MGAVCNSIRNPSSTRCSNLRPRRAASALACRNSSSGNSMVVFIEPNHGSKCSSHTTNVVSIAAPGCFQLPFHLLPQRLRPEHFDVRPELEHLHQQLAVV